MHAAVLKCAVGSALAAFAAPVVIAPAAHAATFQVTKLTDAADGACDADCSLREAVIAANAAAGDDVVQLPSGTLTLSIAGQNEQAAATGDLDVLASGGTVAVRGAGAPATTIDADQVDRVFEVRARARLVLADLTITDGAEFGSAVLVGQSGDGASLDVARAAMTLHRKNSNAIYAANTAAVTITDTTFSDNGAPGGPDSTFGGAGLWLNDLSTATVTRSSFARNRASFGAGIVANDISQLTLSDSTFSQNSVAGGGGALFTRDQTRNTVSGSTFTGNSAGFGGGAIFNQSQATLDISSSTLSQNRALDGSIGGGAIFNQNDAILTITNSTIAWNIATSILGGGGIFHQNAARTTITGSTISGNRALPATGSSGADRGGGAIAGQDQAQAILANTTISGNESGVNGGALLLRNQSVVRATNVTITANTTPGLGAALYNGTIAIVPGSVFAEFANTITFGNLAAGAPSGCAGTAPAAATVSLGHNIDPTATCGAPAAGDSAGDPQLGPLAANGGATLTHAIGAAGAAKDTANPARCPATDQRGVARPQFAACDIGAFELAAPPPSPIPTPPAPVPTPAAKPAAVTFSSLVRLPSAKRCLSRRAFRIRLRVPKGVSVASAEVRVNGRRVKSIRRSRITAPVDLRSLPAGRFSVTIRIKLADGRTISGTRRYRTCKAKLKGGKRPRA